jgi:signal transduction histidine kinase
MGHPSDALPTVARNAEGKAEGNAGEERDLIGLESDPPGTMVKSSAVAVRATESACADARSARLGRVWLTGREAVISAAAIVAAVAAVWVTLRADFLAYPGWLAAQKADLILGPVLIGLYWLRRRPASRFGWVLIGVGLLSIPYILQSFAEPWAFSLGVVWEGVIFVTTLTLILAFPGGRLDEPVVRLILGGAVLVCIGQAVMLTLSPQIAPNSTISSCDGACPPNALLVSSHAVLAGHLMDVLRMTVVALDLATMGVIVRRFATGTPPRRRALAIGTPIALAFLATQIMHQVARTFELGPGPLVDVIRWSFVVARAAIWYGFLIALVAAELFAGRVLRRVVEASLRRPSVRELEAMLRAPLGDPGLRLAFWRSERGDWADRDGVAVQPSGGRVLTAIDPDSRPAVAIVHDAQLADDPELVHAAGAVALLAQENAELEQAWSDSVRQLRDSRARIATAAEAERRALERDLHDGAQQQLTAVLVKLALVGELLPQGSATQVQLAGIECELTQTLEELRRLAHGIYPVPLAEVGIVGALEAVAKRSGGTVDVIGHGIGRYPPEFESAVYYCCLEALQNATKHGGPGIGIAIQLRQSGAELRFEVRDDGLGFDLGATHEGVGLRNMHDRLNALHGQLEITSAPGRGAVVVGTVPVSVRADS